MENPSTSGNITSVTAPMTEQQPMLIAPAHLTPFPLASTTIADLEREVLLPKVSVSNASPINVAVAYVYILQQLLWSLASPVFCKYVYMRYKSIKVRLVPVGSAPTLSGAIRLSALPYDAGVMNLTYFDDWIHSTIPNTVHPFSNASEISLTIPWSQPVSWLSTSEDLQGFFYAPNRAGKFNWPTIAATVASPLANAALTACNINYMVYARFEGLELTVLQDENFDYSSLVVPNLALTASNWSIDDSHAFAGPNGETIEKSKTGVVAGVAGTVAKVASAITTAIPNPITPLFSGVASAVSAAASVFGFDKPATVESSSPVQLRLGDDLIALDGVDSSVKANVDQGVTDQFSTEIMGASVNETNLQQYASQFGVVSVFTASAGDSYPQTYTDVLVGPNNQYINDAQTFLYRPPITMASSYFARWKGDVKFRIHCHLDMFSDAQLFVILSSSAGNESLGSANRSVFKLSGSQVVEFTVPWHAIYDWDYVNNLTRTPQYFWLSIGLLDAVRRQGVPTSATFIVEMAASDEPDRYLLAEPRAMTLHYPGVAASKTLLDTKKVPLGINQNSAITPVDSLLNLLKRYVLSTTIPSDAPIFTPLLNDHGAMTLFLRMFNHHRGSLRFRFYLYPGEAVFIFPVPSLTESYLDPFGFLGGVVPRFETYNPELAVEVHYDGSDYFLKSTQIINTVASAYANLQLFYVETGNTIPDSRPVFVALGDDFFSSCRMCTPLMPLGVPIPDNPFTSMVSTETKIKSILKKSKKKTAQTHKPITSNVVTQKR